MILIQQDCNDFGNIGTTAARLGETELPLNLSMIDDDIRKLEVMRGNPHNSRDKMNINNIINYLKRLKSRVNEEGNYKFTWCFEDFSLCSYPLDLKCFGEYKVLTTDYIELKGSALVKADYHDVFETIAFDMMYRDLDHTMQEIEDKLSNIGMATITPVSTLISLMDGESPLRLSKILRIGDSPYASSDGKLSWDYFSTAADEAFTSGKYCDCVSRSVDVAIVHLVRDIIDKFNENNIKFKICALNETGLYFIIDESSKSNIQRVFDSAIVRAFGRKFEVRPKVTVF